MSPCRYLSEDHLSFNKYTHQKRAYLASGDEIDIENTTKIVAGYEPWHRPWMTFIKISKDRSDYKCGGSIINSYWILSAGHCFCEQLKCKPAKKGKKRGQLRIDYKPEDYIRIVTGLKDISHVKSEKPHQISTPDKIIIHPL